ncbi:hypothetical protein cyc_01446 [Cyclospora cayetanensis]|uniref:Uncharacterized protein n=1 Tax=Cyclospora cayetanensis TaxID=88456 RepID=A0A1D3D5V9_9EIME|nr:hypothetical protein cyc_01446 [Cyclospora cayetanensis]
MEAHSLVASLWGPGVRLAAERGGRVHASEVEVSTLLVGSLVFGEHQPSVLRALRLSKGRNADLMELGGRREGRSSRNQQETLCSKQKTAGGGATRRRTEDGDSQPQPPRQGDETTRCIVEAADAPGRSFRRGASLAVVAPWQQAQAVPQL